MAKPLPFTQAKIERAIRGARAAGLKIGGIEVRPDGTVVVFSAVESMQSSLTTGPKLVDAREKLRDG